MLEYLTFDVGSTVVRTDMPKGGRTVDSAKEKLKGKFLKNIKLDLFMRGQMAAYMNSYR